MPEIRSWDTVFFVKALNQNIGIRVYYEIDQKNCSITYTGDTKEFGVGTVEYNNNPNPGDTTTYSYEFSVVVGSPYTSKEGKKSIACMDIKVDAVQNTETRNSDICSTTSEFIYDDKPHHTTIRIECED